MSEKGNNGEILNVGIDLGTSRSAISSSNGQRHLVESYVGWPVDMVARKVLKKNVLIGDEAQARGTVDHVPVYPREVVKRALELNASAIILVHNHPSGDPTPSKADVEMTRQINRACKAVSVVLHDHVPDALDRYGCFHVCYLQLAQIVIQGMILEFRFIIGVKIWGKHPWCAERQKGRNNSTAKNPGMWVRCRISGHFSPPIGFLF